MTFNRTVHRGWQVSRLAAPVAVLLSLLAGCTGADRIEPRTVSAPIDAEGRQLYDHQHAMDPAALDELRAAIPKFAGLSDAEIMRVMRVMGPNYTWYLSDRTVRNDVGVLVLGHGFQARGDQLLSRRLQPLAASAPTALGLGMSMLTGDHIQLALNNLDAAGVSDIVVVPAVSTRHNTMLRQWGYILGQTDVPAYARVSRAGARARLHFVEPLEDDPLVAEILTDYAREISRNPAREEVIIVAHGPVNADDNAAELAMLQRIAAVLQAGTGFAAVRVATLQDDAVDAVRAANVAALRELLRAAAARNREVLIVTNLLSTRIVQSRLRRDLRGLDYRFNRKGMIQHPNFITWVEQSVRAAVPEAAL